MVDIEKKIESNYYKEVVLLYKMNSTIGIFIAHLFIPLVFVYVLSDYVPHYFLGAFLFYSFITAFVRIILNFVLNKALSKGEDVKKYIKYIVIVMGFSGFSWTIAALLTYYYAPHEYQFFVSVIVIGVISGAISTLTSIFSAFLAFSISCVVPLFILFAMSDELLYNAFSFLIASFIFVTMIAGYRHYKRIKEAILLRDKLRYLNKDLEKEVKSRTKELESINNTLEEKISKEIEKNRAKDQQIMQQSRMAQLGEMISMIAHQWRQPLGAISATSIDIRTKMMLNVYNFSEENEQRCIKDVDLKLSKIESYVNNLTQTIDDFRTFYKPNKQKKISKINEPIKKSLAIIQSSIESSGIAISVDYDSKHDVSMFDNELMQVFLNILKNAQDNLKEKGLKDGKITIITLDNKDCVIAKICDNGGGIPKEITNKIYDPYFSTKNEKNGTGLGLYMSKIIVCDHHNGKLYFENTKDGVCFIVKLPK